MTLLAGRYALPPDLVRNAQPKKKERGVKLQNKQTWNFPRSIGEAGKTFEIITSTKDAGALGCSGKRATEYFVKP